MNYSKQQLTSLVVLRVLIGWHFLYEGMVKIVNPNWSSAEFLRQSKGPFSGFFTSIADYPGLLNIVDFLNEWGLVLIGIGLIAGGFTRIASISGIVLLFLYYISQPPLIGIESSMHAEGNYLIVNKILIEMGSLFVLMLFPTSNIYGLDTFIFKNRKN